MPRHGWELSWRCWFYDVSFSKSSTTDASMKRKMCWKRQTCNRRPAKGATIWHNARRGERKLSPAQDDCTLKCDKVQMSGAKRNARVECEFGTDRPTTLSTTALLFLAEVIPESYALGVHVVLRSKKLAGDKPEVMRCGETTTNQ